MSAPVSLDDIPALLPSMSAGDQALLLAQLDKLHLLRSQQTQRSDFLAYVRAMWPTFIGGRHHKRMARAFEEIISGKTRRLIINMPPRHTKSEFASYLLPSWYLGLFPDRKVIQCSHTADLAVGFGRKVRNLVDSGEYHALFPKVSLAKDSTAAGRWNTNRGGEYFAIGVGGAVTGKGADLLIIDDPHALEITTPIPTPNGFVPLGELVVGDEVFGPDGKPTRVVATSPVYHNRSLYAVTTYDGETILADAKHLWNVRTSTRTKDPYRNLTTEELVEELVEARSSAFMIPRHAAVRYPERDLPIDPWVLGAWLGDGTSSLGRMTAHPDDAPFMRSEFQRRGYETTDLADRFSFGVLKLREQLIDVKLLSNKHIPEAYLVASIEQRMDLLRGLMDTDGNVTAQGQCAFHNKDAKLVDQVVELLRSLGRKCQRRTYQTNGSFGACLMHRVTFKLKDCASMPRKRARTKTTHDKQHRSIKVTQTASIGSVQCITVERPDGLFLAGRGYVVTHNSEQEATQAETTPEIYDKTYGWFTSGPRQRLQPGAAVVVVMTRWSKRDLTGAILQDAANNDAVDEWKVIEFPAILPSGNSLWPEFWPLEELEKIQRDIPNHKWQSQYQQDPVAEGAAIIKREWWREWPEEDPPRLEFILQCWDTAFEKNERADYSACTTWGVFYRENDDGENQANIILLNAVRERVEFPQLKLLAKAQYKEWLPDSVIVEKKASGSPLIYELRLVGIPVQEFTPTRGNDKISRLNAVADIFASGRVWFPARRWAEIVIDEVAGFPFDRYDDYTDTVSMALHRFRQGGYVTTDLDEPDEPRYFKSPRRRAYY
jgi:predicted phage terminase large subunit-like protein